MGLRTAEAFVQLLWRLCVRALVCVWGSGKHLTRCQLGAHIVAVPRGKAVSETLNHLIHFKPSLLFLRLRLSGSLPLPLLPPLPPLRHFHSLNRRWKWLWSRGPWCLGISCWASQEVKTKRVSTPRQVTASASLWKQQVWVCFVDFFCVDTLTVYWLNCNNFNSGVSRQKTYLFRLYFQIFKCCVRSLERDTETGIILNLFIFWISLPACSGAQGHKGQLELNYSPIYFLIITHFQLCKQDSIFI